MNDLTDGLIQTTLCPTPCDATPEVSYAPERPLTAAEHRRFLAVTIIDWMGAEGLSAERAGDVCGVSTNVIVSVMNGVPIHSRIFLKISAIVPGFSAHLIGEK